MIGVLPRLGTMLLVLAVGFIVAKMVGRGVVALCEKLGLQTAAVRSGLVESIGSAARQKDGSLLASIFLTSQGQRTSGSIE